ncbi:hypothetical protein PMEGAS228_40970 [Priestia megaterium]
MDLSRSKYTDISNIASCSIVVFIIIHLQSPMDLSSIDSKKIYLLYPLSIFNMLLFIYADSIN